MNAALFFVPNGRITKAQFQTGVLVLVGLSFILTVLPLLASGAGMMAISSLTSVVGIVLAYCWVALWIKRLHQGGQTGWLTILLVFGWFLISSIVSMVITMIFASEAMSMTPTSGNFMEIMQQSAEMSRGAILPGAIASAVVSLGYAFLLNMLLPSNAGDNKFGPAPG